MELVKCRHSSNLTLPGWSKTGRRTRAAPRLPPPPDHHQRPLTTTASDEDVSDLSCAELATENLPPKKRKLDSSGETSKQHRCNICSRSFSSYQALGGHKAHHSSKERKDEDDGIVITTDDEPPKGGGGAAGVHQHQCTICDKVFSKGQALGGHRRHCQRPMRENKAKIFTFDLNELPPHEHDEICGS